MFIILLALSLSYTDGSGVEYADNTYETLVSGYINMVEYTINAKTVQIIDGNEIINAFGKCTKLKTFLFPQKSKLKKIGSYAFYKTNIESIDLTNCAELAEISGYAFYQCTSLTSLILSDSITTINSYAFNGGAFKSVAIPKNLKTLTYSSFSGGSIENMTFHDDAVITHINSECCSHTPLKKIIIPKSVTNLQNGFIRTELSSVTIQNGNGKYIAEKNIVYDIDKTKIILCAKTVTTINLISTIISIESNALRGTLVNTIIWNDKITTISNWALAEMQLSIAVMPSSINRIGACAFGYSEHLTSIDLSQTKLTSLDIAVFKNCLNLKTVILPDSLQTIDEYAFFNCEKLQTLNIPSKVTAINNGALSGVNKSIVLHFPSDSPFAFDEQRILYSNNKQTIVQLLTEKTGVDIKIPKEVKSIGSEAFKDTVFNSIKFDPENQLESISVGAFIGARLSSIELPSSCKVLGNESFSGSTLGSIKFPGAVFLNSSSFNNNINLVSIDIPSTVTYIGDSAFSGCVGLKTITMTNSNLKSIGNYAFANTAIEDFTVQKYVTEMGYYVFKNSLLKNLIFHSDSVITTTPVAAFSTSINLKSITFSASIKVIGRQSFENCISLTTLRLSANIVNISEFSFKNCSQLKVIDLPENSKLENILSQAFESCTSLDTFDISKENVNFSPEGGVLYNKELSTIIVYLPGCKDKEFVIKDSVKEIRAFAFQKCQNLINITLPLNIERIGFCSFDGCSNLNFINIPNGVQEIGNNAFQGCIFPCDGILYDHNNITIYNMLVSAQANSEAFLHCPTLFFTTPDFKDPTLFIAAVVSALAEGGE